MKRMPMEVSKERFQRVTQLRYNSYQSLECKVIYDIIFGKRTETYERIFSVR